MMLASSAASRAAPMPLQFGVPRRRRLRDGPRAQPSLCGTGFVDVAFSASNGYDDHFEWAEFVVDITHVILARQRYAQIWFDRVTALRYCLARRSAGDPKQTVIPPSAQRQKCDAKQPFSLAYTRRLGKASAGKSLSAQQYWRLERY